MEANTLIDLNGGTLTLGSLEIAGAHYGAGTYAAAGFAAGVADSSAEKAGRLVVLGSRGTVIAIY